MPAIVTHDLFGRAVADDVADLMNFRSVDERDAYLLGNQGPDPLFYLVAHPLMAKWSKLGNTMHDASPAPLLVAMREAADQLEGRERGIARAYEPLGTGLHHAPLCVLLAKRPHPRRRAGP